MFARRRYLTTSGMLRCTPAPAGRLRIDAGLTGADLQRFPFVDCADYVPRSRLREVLMRGSSTREASTRKPRTPDKPPQRFKETRPFPIFTASRHR
jgi:hypothetical protein